ncbi:hypothetical protein CR203_03915 [Salipaludibacillus neizhouensis]|uniref:Uncharacterized protein n=1 Tax=Salipaludibacillus neizhouensis TaxID=885475 RepID=A0A3A9KC24_9BACI|nr:DUF3891 family protein [Salipaludibacillus neizhouensis]RKL69188.1 hypothetical protein CR203_03915 [Salipaludibacillus neizhouensis]
MIIQNHHKDHVICIEQHEHALISGQFVRDWKDDYFIGKNMKKSVEHAVINHDRSWIPLDKNPIYLPEKSKLASFTDFPMEQKLQSYRSGIVQLLNEDLYAGFLLSCHYASFFSNTADKLGITFLLEEDNRQNVVKEALREKKLLPLEREREFHFNLLQLCDNLSLYICMNRWGARKEEEITWFKDGFKQELLKDQRIYPEWLSETMVTLDPYPFSHDQLQIEIPFKRLSKNDLAKPNIQNIYRDTPKEHHKIIFSKKH